MLARQELSLPAEQDAQRKESQGEEGGPGPPAVVKKQEAKKVVNPLFEKRTLALGRTSSPKEI